MFSDKHGREFGADTEPNSPFTLHNAIVTYSSIYANGHIEMSEGS